MSIENDITSTSTSTSASTSTSLVPSRYICGYYQHDNIFIDGDDKDFTLAHGVLPKAFPLYSNHHLCSLSLSSTEALWLVLRGLLRVASVPTDEYNGYVQVHRTPGNAARMTDFLEEGGEGVEAVRQHRAGRMMSTQELYSILLARDASFALTFAAYSYFRERGFWVRTGINYGTDLTLYRDLPARCHSEFCVLVVNDTGVLPGANSNSGVHCLSSADKKLQPDDHTCSSDLTLPWSHVFALTRIMPDVQKLLLCCYISSTNGVGPAPTLCDDLCYLQVTPTYVWGPRQFATNEEFKSVLDCQCKYSSSKGTSSKLAAPSAARVGVGVKPNAQPTGTAQLTPQSGTYGGEIIDGGESLQSVTAGATGSVTITSSISTDVLSGSSMKRELDPSVSTEDRNQYQSTVKMSQYSNSDCDSQHVSKFTRHY